MKEERRPKLAVYKFSSCDGCQLSLLDCEDELLALAGAVDIAYFPEARRRMIPGPYDLGLVEGSVSTEEEIAKIKHAREDCAVLMTIGVCATYGGVQALRNWMDFEDLKRIAYPKPEFIHSLAASTPIAAHVRVDYELHGCPVNKEQLLQSIMALLARRSPPIPAYSVCVECKLRGNACVLVAGGTPCLGPVTRAGCAALCPAYGRGCYGCFGPMDDPNVPALAAQFKQLGLSDDEIRRRFQMITGYAPGFRDAADIIRRLGAGVTTPPPPATGD